MSYPQIQEIIKLASKEYISVMAKAYGTIKTTQCLLLEKKG
jgi:hypothetical protein